MDGEDREMTALGFGDGGMRALGFRVKRGPTAWSGPGEAVCCHELICSGCDVATTWRQPHVEYQGCH